MTLKALFRNIFYLGVSLKLTQTYVYSERFSRTMKKRQEFAIVLHENPKKITNSVFYSKTLLALNIPFLKFDFFRLRIMLELNIICLEKGKADFFPKFLAINNIIKLQPYKIFIKK